jgi:hypothetical protein
LGDHGAVSLSQRIKCDAYHTQASSITMVIALGELDCAFDGCVRRSVMIRNPGFHCCASLVLSIERSKLTRGPIQSYGGTIDQIMRDRLLDPGSWHGRIRSRDSTYCVQTKCALVYFKAAVRCSIEVDMVIQPSNTRCQAHPGRGEVAKLDRVRLGLGGGRSPDASTHACTADPHTSTSQPQHVK